ncbi:MAG: hypothetical protein HRU76_13745 [Phycisphaeraceae bacterium]|nr:MAG: hypothetical protein HRU76_13745 [Phycisphaeraceae bacterium]
MLATLHIMRAVVRDALHSPLLHSLASRISSHVHSRDPIDHLRAVARFLGAAVSFKADPFGVEHLRTPEQLIEEIEQHGNVAADCDDLAMLAAALIRSIGLEPYFVVAGRTQRLTHVFPAARVRGGAIIPMDVQEGLPVGRWPEGVARQVVFRAI